MTFAWSAFQPGRLSGCAMAAAFAAPCAARSCWARPTRLSVSGSLWNPGGRVELQRWLLSLSAQAGSCMAACTAQGSRARQQPSATVHT
jgi:hypothetical protein